MATIHEANRQAPRLSDLLRDYPLPAWALDHPYRTDPLAYDRYMRDVAYDRYMRDVAYARMRPIEIDGPFDLGVDRVDVRLGGPVRRERAMEVARILAELDRQYMLFARAGMQPRDMDRAAFTIQAWEADLLRGVVLAEELERHGFNVRQEGVAATYRGFPLRILNDLRTDPVGWRP